MKKKGRGKAPVGSTFHLSSQEEELVLEEGVVDVSEVVGAEVEAAQNNLAQMEEEHSRKKAGSRDPGSRTFFGPN